MLPANLVKEFRTIQEVMNVPGLKARLVTFADESIACKQKIQIQKEDLKAYKERACEELGLKPQVFAAYVDMIFKNDYIDRRDKHEEMIEMIETVMRDADIAVPQLEN